MKRRVQDWHIRPTDEDLAIWDRFGGYFGRAALAYSVAREVDVRVMRERSKSLLFRPLDHVRYEVVNDPFYRWNAAANFR